MKHKEYASGVLTGVLVVALAAGGGKFVQQRQYNGVLSDSSHVQKIEYLEKMIEEWNAYANAVTSMIQYSV